MGKKLAYKWVIAAACFILCIVGLGLCSGNKALFLVATSEALGISRSAYAVSYSLRYISTAVVNIFFGNLLMKFGTRKLIGAGLVILVASCVADAVAETVVGLYIAGILLGVGLTFAGTTVIGCVIRQWFPDHQGAVLGVVLSANALGAAVTAPWFSAMIYGNDVFGYRKVYWIVAGILVVSGIVLMLLFKEPTKRDGEPRENERKPAKTRRWEGLSYEEEKKKPYFYIIWVCLFLTGVLLLSTAGVSAAHMKDRGVPPEFIALVTSVYALMLAASKFLIGTLCDKKGLQTATLTCNAAALGMTVLLCVVSGSGWGKLLAMTYAVFAGLALPLQTVLLPLMASDMFCEKDYGKALGMFVAASNAGSVTGTMLSNLCFDRWGTYLYVFIADAVLIVAISVAFVVSYRKMMAPRNSKV